MAVDSRQFEPGLVRRGRTCVRDAAAAVRDVASQLHPPTEAAAVVFFCSDHYAPSALARALNQHIGSCPVFGCTTAGEVGHRYQTGGIVAVSFAATHFRVRGTLLPQLLGLSACRANASVTELLEELPGLAAGSSFALTLLDGLSVAEELVAGLLDGALGGIPLIGGSAGDLLHFDETRVYADGEFHKEAGVLLLVESQLSVQPFQLMHFEPTERDLVITGACPERRLVTEIDAEPAAVAYARQLGLTPAQLSPGVFSNSPLVLQIGGEWYVRSIQRANPDGSLQFYCAIEEGLPLTIARSVGLVESLTAKVNALHDDFHRVEATIGADCVLRRLEAEAQGLTAEVEMELERLAFAGFSTFGEQFGGVHVNQTLTGVAIGVR